MINFKIKILSVTNDGLTVPECMTHTLPLLYPSTAFNTSPPCSFYYNWLYTIY